MCNLLVSMLQMWVRQEGTIRRTKLVSLHLDETRYQTRVK
ncbi:MAG: hypothetical protein BROFUL_00297 [Candidatus Brocadia fulgida]|uniref:Uncharacterized protein n=1 Tax=Candidatus Brocadia fulgida TaxID=380242 RepID=A0A0M2UYR6_9BACT|nr:MAG: hypothetical protein BROFUL_00297 [Candidatus Brocadia fulgida]